MQPSQKPITGTEDIGDLSRPEQALAQFYKAFNSRDLKMLDDNFEKSEELVLDNPIGGIRRGSNQPHLVYERIFNSPADVKVEFTDYTIHRFGDVFWAVGRERGSFKVGDARRDLLIRTSRIYRKTDGRWRQIHHHGSIEDPQLLEVFQAAFR